MSRLTSTQLQGTKASSAVAEAVASTAAFVEVGVDCVEVVPRRIGGPEVEVKKIFFKTQITKAVNQLKGSNY